MIDAVQEVCHGTLGMYVSKLGYHPTELFFGRLRNWHDAAPRSGNHGQTKASSRLLLGDLIRDREQWAEWRAILEGIARVT